MAFCSLGYDDQGLTKVVALGDGVYDELRGGGCPKRRSIVEDDGDAGEPSDANEDEIGQSDIMGDYSRSCRRPGDREVLSSFRITI